MPCPICGNGPKKSRVICSQCIKAHDRTSVEKDYSKRMSDYVYEGARPRPEGEDDYGEDSFP